MLAIVLLLLALAVAQNDPCTASSGCASFTVVKIATADNRTQIRINATNLCAQGVFYVQFALGVNPVLVPVGVPTSYSGIYAWTTSIVTDSAVGVPSQQWLRFTASPGQPNAQMAAGSGGQWEIFNFFVTNYYPMFPWYFQMHVSAYYPTVGPLDMSLCQCTDNCDAGFFQRTIRDCTLGYYDTTTGIYSGPTNRAASIFNENKDLYSYQIYNNYLALFYTDEWPMCLGVRQVVNSLDGTTIDYPVTVSKDLPTCVFGNSIQFGATNFDGWNAQAGIDGNGPANGCIHSTPAAPNFTCGRPMPPTLYITDITNNVNARDGDWQFGGQAHLPQKVCGLWKAAIKTVTGQNTGGDYVFSVVPESTTKPASNYLGNNQWNFGAGSDVPPIGFINPSAVGTVPYPEIFGTEVAWDLDSFGLISKHSYRFQFLVHDGDSTKVGGDVGQACLITSQACPAGFSGTNCDVCDTNPLPSDGSWTWWCSPTGQQNPAYNLQKLPSAKVSQAPYVGSGGFIPSLNYTDSAGYLVGCNCVRRIVPCPEACCGNGVCRDNIGVCSCFQNVSGMNTTSCCLPPPPPPVPPVPPPVPPPPPPPVAVPPPVTPPVPPPVAVPVYQPVCADMITAPYNGTNTCGSCINNTLGLQCAWCPSNVSAQPPNATLVNGNCKPIGQCGGPEFYTCIPPPPPPTCEANLSSPGITCATCVSNSLNIQCAWCPSSSVDKYSNASLINGSCVTYTTCPADERYTCYVPPPPPPPPCFNGGVFCSGHGTCVNNTCVCTPQPPLNFTGAACEIVIQPPKPTCVNVSAPNCSACLNGAAAMGLYCVWCPNQTATDYLSNGNCTEDYNCGNNASLLTCVPPVQIIPPECPDNCTGHGICVNVTFCLQIYNMPSHAWTDAQGNVYTCDGDALNTTLANNQSSLCACLNGFQGINCIVPATPINIGLAAGLAAGVIAAIVIAAILAGLLCGGGAIAATSAVASGPGAGVLVNPLYEPEAKNADNPLWRA